MKDRVRVIAEFSSALELRDALRELRGKHSGEVEVYTPFPSHEVEEELYRSRARSPVRFFTLLGGLIGCLGAFLMTCWMSMDYPLRVSAKPIVSIPAFVVIAFECTILLGGIFTLFSMCHFSRIPNICGNAAYRGTFSLSAFGLVVVASEEESLKWKSALEERGAKHVQVQHVQL
jgi:hypothetical protein